MNIKNRQTILYVFIPLFSTITIWLCSVKFVFPSEKVIILAAYVLAMRYLLSSGFAAVNPLKYAKPLFYFATGLSIILGALSSLANFLDPVYDRKIINGKVYYITGSPSFNNDWSVELIEYNFGFTETVETYYIHGIYRPKLSIESNRTGLYIKEQRY